jgi:hypothetical protein
VGAELSDFYVYVLFRPWNGSPCYVGKGRGNRAKLHLWLGRRHYNRHMANIIAKAKDLGLDIPCCIVRSGLTEEVAFETEIAFIAAIGRKKNGGPLVNLTDGGDGASGYTHSAEGRANMSAARSRSQLGKKRGPQSAEHRAAISRSLKGKGKGRQKSAETRLAMKKPKSSEHRAKIGAAHLGMKRSQKARENIRAGVLAAWERKKSSRLECQK